MATLGRRARLLCFGAALTPLSLLAACGGGGGDPADFPEDNIEVVVPFAAGGPTDTVTRMIAEPMAEELGVELVVQNVEGAGGTVAAGQVAEAEPDGYTMLMHHIGMSTAPALYPDLEFDPEQDFKTVGLVTEVPMTVIARKDLEPETLEELVAYLEDNQDTVTLANAGIGSASHLCGVLLQQATGVTLQEVPYDGTGPAMEDLVGGQVDVLCDQTTNTTQQITEGTVKAYAVTTPEPVESLPDLPTAADAGLPDLEVTVWHGLYVPAETDDAIVEKLTAALQAALQDEAVIDEMAGLGTAPVAQDQAAPEAHSELLSAEIDKWGEVLSGIQAE